MRAHSGRAALWLVAAGTLLAFGSCSDSSPAPTPIPNRTTPVPTVPVITSLQLGAPESIAPGATAQLTVTALKSDGSSEALTSGIQWLSNNTRILRVDSQGLVSALVTGEARVTANVSGRSASNTIFVLPSGTFRLTGRLVEEGVAVGGATVTVIAGTGQGLTANTNSNGSYTLYGVAGSIRLHSKKAGYLNVIQDIHVSGNSTHDVTMTPERTREALSGQYRLTISATGCSSISGELQRRSYDATLDQQGSRVSVTLSGADFIVVSGRGNHFEGSYDTDGRVTFNLLGSAPFFYYYYYYYFTQPPDVVERVTPSSALVISGNASTRVNGGVIAGDLNGTLGLTNRITTPFWPYASQCQSGRHGFELRRR
jgi:hypothetical protein